MDDEEAAMLWQDVLDEVSAGRAGSNLRCPFCSKGEISVDRNDQRLRLECRACRRFIEGRLNATAI